MSNTRLISVSFLMLLLLEGKFSRDELQESRLRIVDQSSTVTQEGMDPQVLAHELSAPVSALNVLTNMLAKGDLTPDAHREIDAAIKGELNILRSLIADVEALAAPATGPYNVTLQPAAVRALFQETIRHVETINPHIDIRIDCAPDLVALADAGRIQQVLRNLVGNAARYAGHAAPIELKATRVDDRVRIEVIDQGPGIPATLLPRIFEKHVRGVHDDAEANTGKGYGLFICREIVKAHGSKLEVHSSLRRGTIFSFELRGTDDQTSYR